MTCRLASARFRGPQQSGKSACGVRGGKLKPIGIAAAQRHPLLPQVRTFDEMGLYGVDSDNWYALFAPRGMSTADVARVAAALRQALATESIGSKLEASGAQPAASGPAELTALLKKDTAKWNRVVKSKGIKAE